MITVIQTPTTICPDALIVAEPVEQKDEIFDFIKETYRAEIGSPNLEIIVSVGNRRRRRIQGATGQDSCRRVQGVATCDHHRNNRNILFLTFTSLISFFYSNNFTFTFWSACPQREWHDRLGTTRLGPTRPGRTDITNHVSLFNPP